MVQRYIIYTIFVLIFYNGVNRQTDSHQLVGRLDISIIY